MQIEIATSPFDPWAEVSRHERTLPKGRCGAAAVFVGTMRDFNEGDEVRGMTLEHYPGMTERNLESIAAGTMDRLGLDDVLIVHRVGPLEPGDPIVLVAAWSAHRAAAFDGCREIMEHLKSKAPFWKKETLARGTRWVERNTPG